MVITLDGKAVSAQPGACIFYAPGVPQFFHAPVPLIHNWIHVDGNIKEDSGEICKPIGRNPKDRKLMAVVQDGRYAHTLFTVLERFGDYTLVSYQLKTGRTHQIRVHSKSIGHPVIGDEKYGGSNKFGLSGQLLHAEKLQLIHPKSGEIMTFTAPLPPHFEKVLKKLRDRK